LIATKEEEKGHHGHEGHHHEHGANDPHVWLGLPMAIAMVQSIATELAEKDPAHAEGYQQRAEAYIEKLKKLHADGREKLAGKKVKLVPVHESLAYFAQSFDLELLPPIQFQPGDEPGSARLTELVNRCVQEGARIIAVEPQYPDNAARTLLSAMKQKGVPDPEMVVIDPLETVADGVNGPGYDAGWYERKMAENIDNLVKALR
jgi:ABC-type Zn uptake system ZnuABC Zn-binding protein ZnuA